VVEVDANDDEANGMRRSGRQKDERAAVESAASKRAARQVGPGFVSFLRAVELCLINRGADRSGSDSTEHHFTTALSRHQHVKELLLLLTDEGSKSI
jgi:hypothetical protein